VTVCAFLAPEPVLASWFPRAAGLSGPLATAAKDPVTWGAVLGGSRCRHWPDWTSGAW
jgi:hypothetical protein